MADEIIIPVQLHQESEFRIHAVVGKSFRGHQVHNGHECRCEPGVLIPKDEPRARIYFHEVAR